MTVAEFRAALQLLDTATAALHRPETASAGELRRRLRRLAREFNLLRARLGQPDARLQRN